jgi:HEAT repeat protein
LTEAVADVDESVRCAAISAIADLSLPVAGDLLAAALGDAEPDVRFFAALGLQKLGDARAPDDPEAFAYRST